MRLRYLSNLGQIYHEIINFSYFLERLKMFLKKSSLIIPFYVMISTNLT